MIDKHNEFFINYPVFTKHKSYFDFLKWQRVRYLKKFNISERIVEIPFAFQALSTVAPNGKILDLGCAESIFPLQLATLGYQVTGVDFRPYPYKHPNLSFSQADILNLPFADQSFDAVCAISTLEHIGLGSYDDPQIAEKPDQQAFKHIVRILKDKGTLILTVPFGKYAQNSHQRVYDQPMLNTLLQDFDIMQIKYYTINSKGNNDVEMYWSEVNVQQASQIISDSTTRTVCLIKALLK